MEISQCSCLSFVPVLAIFCFAENRYSFCIIPSTHLRCKFLLVLPLCSPPSWVLGIGTSVLERDGNCRVLIHQLSPASNPCHASGFAAVPPQVLMSLKQDGKRNVFEGQEQQYWQAPGPNPRSTVSKRQHTIQNTSKSTVKKTIMGIRRSAGSKSYKTWLQVCNHVLW